jgi:hypothetical protein
MSWPQIALPTLTLDRLRATDARSALPSRSRIAHPTEALNRIRTNNESGMKCRLPLFALPGGFAQSFSHDQRLIDLDIQRSFLWKELTPRLADRAFKLLHSLKRCFIST